MLILCKVGIHHTLFLLISDKGKNKQWRGRVNVRHGLTPQPTTLKSITLHYILVSKEVWKMSLLVLVCMYVRMNEYLYVCTTASCACLVDRKKKRCGLLTEVKEKASGFQATKERQSKGEKR